ncbi:hypothetical protein M8C21_018380, partial [Ambrosia artemisiifolia]
MVVLILVVDEMVVAVGRLQFCLQRAQTIEGMCIRGSLPFKKKKKESTSKGITLA